MSCIRKFVTYVKNNEELNKFYCGHSSKVIDNDISDIDAAKIILKRRENNHHKNKENYQYAKLDKISTNRDAIIGREQMLFEYFSATKKTGNKLNPISPQKMHKMIRCKKMAIKLFGTVCLILIILLLLN